MYNNKKIIAIIPARSGSKGLPDKNIKEFAGKPLLAYTILAALESKIFDYVMVSTDSEKYAEIAKEYGAKIPFLRSNENSVDTADSISVVQEVLSKLDEQFDLVVLLQPTSPLRTSQNIVEGMQLFFEKQAKIVISVCEMSHPVAWCNTLPANLSMEAFIKEEFKNKRRQDIEQYYTLNGALYIFETNLLRTKFTWCQSGAYAYIMKVENSVDIDNHLDFIMAEAVMYERLNVYNGV